MSKSTQSANGLPVIHQRAAGIDIGSRFHVVAVPPHLSDEPVQTFQAFTADLQRLVAWFQSIGVQTVVMESTGVYWVPVFEVLESAGIDVIVANARETRSVPGHKSDINDAQWLQRLHAYLRHRERLLDYTVAHIQHMQKALTFMNIQLHHVVQDITGVTGMKIIRAIVMGERNPDVLAEFRDVRCKASTETIRGALVGNYQPEHVFALTQSLALRLIAECGTDLSKWRTAKHFTSWLTLSPGCKISGGKVLSAHSRKSNNRLTAHLRLAAVTVGKTNTALGAFYRRLAARIGKAKAVTATARKIAILFYNTMRFGMDYSDPGADHYEQKYRERVIKQLHRRAAEFGLELHQVECVS